MESIDFMQSVASMESTNTWFLVLGTGHLFATKWVHIKHYGLKIGVPNFWWDYASFLNSKNPEITQMGSKIPGTCYSRKKKAPCQEACKQSSGVGKHPQMVNPSKLNSGFGQTNDFFPKQKTNQRIGQIEAVAWLTPLDTSIFIFDHCWKTFRKIRF